MQDDDQVRLADLLDMDEEMNSLGHRYYTLELRTIPYRSPAVTSHPITVKAKEVADGLNEEYLEVCSLHQNVKVKLTDFKKQLDQPEYTDLATCLAQMQKSSKSHSLQMRLDSESESPVRLEGGSSNVEAAVSDFNAMIEACHHFLNNMDFHMDRIRDKIRELRKMAVSQHILDICSTFEEHASTNIDICAIEIRSVLLDARSAGKTALK